jgi:hypothetical protein
MFVCQSRHHVLINGPVTSFRDAHAINEQRHYLRSPEQWSGHQNLSHYPTDWCINPVVGALLKIQKHHDVLLSLHWMSAMSSMYMLQLNKPESALAFRHPQESLSPHSRSCLHHARHDFRHSTDIVVSTTSPIRATSSAAFSDPGLGRMEKMTSLSTCAMSPCWASTAILVL